MAQKGTFNARSLRVSSYSQRKDVIIRRLPQWDDLVAQSLGPLFIRNGSSPRSGICFRSWVRTRSSVEGEPSNQGRRTRLRGRLLQVDQSKADDAVGCRSAAPQLRYYLTRATQSSFLQVAGASTYTKPRCSNLAAGLVPFHYLIDNIFCRPHTKIEFVQRDLDVSRLTATNHLDALVSGGVPRKRKRGRSNYYAKPRFKILTGAENAGVHPEFARDTNGATRLI